MDIAKVIGSENLKKYLIHCVDKGLVPHAQLFSGSENSGILPMAIGYASYLLTSSSSNKEACQQKCAKLAHPDLHFVFPTATNQKIKSKPTSRQFINEWRTFYNTQPYGSLFDWYAHIGVENKQGQIGVDDAQQILADLKLKSYEGGYKVTIIWMAEKLNTAASNKLLKLVEEPPPKTALILISEKEGLLIDTLKSRCRILNFPKLSESQISTSLIKEKNLGNKEAERIAQQAGGSYHKALQLIHGNPYQAQFEEWFINWVRMAFKARNDASVIKNIIDWSALIAKEGRETQKQFLNYSLNVFRQALLVNYKAPSLATISFSSSSFSLSKFAPYIHSKNIHPINTLLNTALKEIERNGNAKIVLLDLSIKITRLLHVKE